MLAFAVAPAVIGFGTQELWGLGRDWHGLVRAVLDLGGSAL